MIKKRCSKCGKIKPIKYFTIRKNRKSGYWPWCRDCKNKYQREYNKRDYVKIKRNVFRKKNDIKYKTSPKGKNTNKQYEQQSRNNLHDRYVKSVLTKQSSLTHADIPQELIEIKRLQLQLIRELKKQCNKM